MNRIVCVGAHPDDVEIGMGGTVAAMVAEGLRVTLVDLTDGEPTPCGTRETRMAEAAEAASALGAERVTLTLPNRYLFDSVEARSALAEVLREIRPGVLFAPYPADAHPDHVAASAIATAARFYAKFTKTELAGEPHYPAKLYRYMAVHVRLFAPPAFVVDVSGHIGSKRRALEAYRSQFVLNERNAGVIQDVMDAGSRWGSFIGSHVGEPFYCDELVGIRSVSDLV